MRRDLSESKSYPISKKDREVRAVYNYKIIVYTPVWDENTKTFNTKRSIYYSKDCNFYETTDTVPHEWFLIPRSRDVIVFELIHFIFVGDNKKKTMLEDDKLKLTIPKDSKQRVIVVDLRDRKILYESK